jgi:type IV fimbrial biogenesis protein FimT
MHTQGQSGLTLVELMLSMAVVVIMLAIGVPSFTQMIKNNRLVGQTNDLVIAFQLARNEAVKHGTGTVICASDDQATCSGNNDWSTGWIVFSDIDQEGDLEIGSDACLSTEDCVMRIRQQLEGNNALTADVSQARYQPNGLLQEADIPGGSDRLTFTLVANDCRHNQARIITITRHGHPNLAKTDCP